MYTVEYKPSFVRDMKIYRKYGRDEEKVRRVIKLLASGQPLPPGLSDHQLHGKFRHYRELHIETDWLLVYQKDGKKLHIACIWLVSHKKLKERERSA